MSVKKRLLFGFIKNVAKRKNAKSYITKILIGVTVGVLLLTIVAVALIGYGFSQVSQLVAKEPNTEFVALETLIAEDKLVLSEEQKVLAVPLLRDIVTNETLAPEEIQKIEDQILSILTPVQLQDLQQRQEEILQETKALGGVSIQIVEKWITDVTGLSIQSVGEIMNSVFTFWEVKDPGNEAPKQLLEQMEKQ